MSEPTTSQPASEALTGRPASEQTPSRPILERLAGAPISWGVCEVPGWGYQVGADDVLRQMREVGLPATEFGPDGFLPVEPAAKAARLAEAGLASVGGFVPVVLHESAHDPLSQVEPALDGFVAAGAGTLVLAAATGRAGYDQRPVLDAEGWATLLANLDRCAQAAAARGVLATLHPHVGTMVEQRAEVERVLDGSGIALCLDTGHLLIGGTDPVDLAKTHADQIAHVHLKDVDATWAERVQAGESTYTAAVAAGMYRPLGQGDADIADLVRLLEDRGYDGWYVLEQDTVLDGPPEHDGPPADVRTSVEFVRALAERAGSAP